MTLFESAGESSRMASLDNFEFTFETYLQDAERIEPDPNPSNKVFDTQSLSESIARYEEENGRTYHSYHSGSYPYPNDPTETERLDEQHAILRHVLDGRNHLAPFSRTNPPSRVLDIACGTGTWAIEMGDAYPESQIVGTDLSPIQPRYVPPNVRFFVEDSAEDWLYTTPFNYIHTRMTLGCWSSPRHQILQRSYDHLVPGGYFEAQEVLCLPTRDDDGPPLTPHNSAWMRWIREVEAASDATDRVLCLGPELKREMEEVGFVDVQERVFKLPMNGWPLGAEMKQLGLMWQRNLLNGLSGFSLGLLHRVRGRTLEDIELQLVDVRRELFNTSMHAYQKFYVVWGRKPGGG